MTDSRVPARPERRGTSAGPVRQFNNPDAIYGTGDRPQHGVVRGHVVTAVGVLRTRIAEPWTLSSLASEVHLSRSQLVRSFDAVTGNSPMAYLRQMRAEQMARLLVSTDLSIAEAARSVGWRNQFHASQCFQGMSRPS